VLSVPELRGDEDVFTFDVELLEGALDALSYLFLVLVAGWWDISSAQFLRMKEATPPPHRGAIQPNLHRLWMFRFQSESDGSR
jgi:hypothetical protein